MPQLKIILILGILMFFSCEESLNSPEKNPYKLHPINAMWEVVLQADTVKDKDLFCGRKDFYSGVHCKNIKDTLDYLVDPIVADQGYNFFDSIFVVDKDTFPINVSHNRTGFRYCNAGENEYYTMCIKGAPDYFGTTQYPYDTHERYYANDFWNSEILRWSLYTFVGRKTLKFSYPSLSHSPTNNNAFDSILVNYEFKNDTLMLTNRQWGSYKVKYIPISPPKWWWDANPDAKEIKKNI